MEDDRPGTFNAASVWGRIAVVAAGPVFNFILAFVLSVIMVSLAGYDPAEVLDVKTESSAEKAGLQTGDVITEYEGYTIDLSRDLYLYTYFKDVYKRQALYNSCIPIREIPRRVKNSM